MSKTVAVLALVASFMSAGLGAGPIGTYGPISGYSPISTYSQGQPSALYRRFETNPYGPGGSQNYGPGGGQSYGPGGGRNPASEWQIIARVQPLP